MRRDRRPYFIRRLIDLYIDFYIRHYIEPAFDAVGPGLAVSSPRNVEIWGGGIRIGKHLHLNAARANMVRLATWNNGTREGRITIGDHVLISPGTHIVASESITIGNNTMIASGCYISDSDWHDTYDRTAELGKHAPVTLEENVWLGVRVIVGKGVTIGKNTIVGAGSVVTKSLPANCIAAGNPATVMRQLDPEGPFRLRETLFSTPDKTARDMENLKRFMARDNTLLNWLRSVLSPTRED